MTKAAFACLLAAAVLAPGADPQFEVATVRPNHSVGPASHMGRGPSAKNGKFIAENISLKTLIASAYEVREFQVAGPGWLASEQYDITAKLPQGMADNQIALMLRALLEERFHLRTHRETAEMSIYALMVGKAGPKFHALAPGEEFKPPAFPPKSAFTLLNGSMARWGEVLSGIVGRPVLDKTGITGSFMFMLAYSGNSDDSPSPDIFGAVEEELGLKLEPQKGPVEILKVDSAERVPDQN
jgi:uncharacterized protein (TIGR03435 family)